MPVDSPIVARNRLARAHRNADGIDPEYEVALRANLSTAKCDAAIREALVGAPPLAASQISHLIGTLLMNSAGMNADEMTAMRALVDEIVARVAQAGGENA